MVVIAKNLKLQELIYFAKSGNKEAMTQIIKCFIPIAKKYSSQLGYDEIYSDLIIWIIKAVYYYKPNTINKKMTSKI
ncbi:helix-turn-helix domain-containing protein [Thermoanaerobacter mathranii]|uniref:helix-turn-helix domain-containing protein n=1 Tax=Thermoanaerobacter mathranii TaxID=583357 RepID=UPI003D6A8B16